jgi:hypothetical protein
MRGVSCGVPLGARHAKGHQLGPLGAPLGETSCISLPAVSLFDTSVKAGQEKQATLAASSSRSPPYNSI